MIPAALPALIRDHDLSHDDFASLRLCRAGADSVSTELLAEFAALAGFPIGYLWFFGRKKQVIVHDGSNISPVEVEGALDEHPAVDLAGVVGVHDQVHGENVRAYVTLRPDAERPRSAQLIVHCRERIGYKAPEEVVFLDEMPLNPTGKIDRVGLKRLAEEHLHPHGLD